MEQIKNFNKVITLSSTVMKSCWTSCNVSFSFINPGAVFLLLWCNEWFITADVKSNRVELAVTEDGGKTGHGVITAGDESTESTVTATSHSPAFIIHNNRVHLKKIWTLSCVFKCFYRVCRRAQKNSASSVWFTQKSTKLTDTDNKCLTYWYN